MHDSMLINALPHPRHVQLSKPLYFIMNIAASKIMGGWLTVFMIGEVVSTHRPTMYYVQN